MCIRDRAINGGAFSAVFFLGAGDELAYAICIGISAIGYGEMCIRDSRLGDLLG